MLVYDTTATAWVAGNGGMAAFSQDAVNRMNQAVQNSNVDISFRLVHAMSVNYTTTSNSSTPLTQDLNALAGGSGPFAAVHVARNDYGADIVAMLVDHGSAYGYVGQGYVLWTWSGIPGNAFSVNAVRSVDISHTLTHEVGHNFGAHHAKAQTQSPGPNNHLSNPSAPYSAGWYFTGTNGVRYHSIMAYNSNLGLYYSSAPLFSTPLINSQGTPAGHTADGDNARLLRLTKDLTAGYREAQTAPAVPAAPAASDGTYTDKVRVTWSPVPDAASYRLFRCTGSGTGTCGQLLETAALSHDDTGATPGQTYQYRLQSCGAGLCSDFSEADPGFRAITYVLSVGRSGEFGTSSISSNPSGIDCGSTCSQAFGGGTQVTLSVALASGYQFEGWSGSPCDSLVGDACVVTVDGPKNLTAGFSRLAHYGIADVDGNGSATALTDGLLIIRRLFGFGGAPLTDGAVAADCTRCSAEAIAAHIDANRDGFDVDGNSETTALTDGLLIIRYLFGFGGTALTDGAVGAGCTRCTATEIEEYCAGLVP